MPLVVTSLVVALATPSGALTPSGPGRPEAQVTEGPADAHACIVATARAGAPRIAWSQLRNPILSSPVAGVKDEALVWTGGRWHMLFSYVTTAPGHPGRARWQIASSTSPDLARWSAPRPWPSQPGARDAASPDVVRSPAGRFVVTYQATPTTTGASQAKLYYRTSSDLSTWSAARPLAANLAPRPGDRQIDAALAWTPAGLLLAFKSGATSSSQAFELARSASGSLNGPWTLVGRPAISLYNDTIENYELVNLSGQRTLLATSNVFDQPWLFTLAGDPTTPAAWLTWTPGRQLMVPGQAWDSGPGLSSVNYEHANSAFLCDARSVDGHYYLLYAGSSELTQFGGWGHAKIGVARSTDLVNWEVPPPG